MYYPKERLQRFYTLGLSILGMLDTTTDEVWDWYTDRVLQLWQEVDYDD